MKLYDSIFVPDPKGNWEAQHINGGNFEDECIEWKSGPVIVLTPDELLDLMQESIEHSYPTLLREKAVALLISKGIQLP